MATSSSSGAAAGATLSTLASSPALMIIELLEHIIYQLDSADQLIALQVCKTWNALVRTSPRIQPSAFPWDKPMPATEFLVWTVENDIKRRPIGDQYTLWQPRLSSEPSATAMILAHINPVLHIASSPGSKAYKCCTKIEIDGRKILSWSSDFWRGQLLVQPPVPLSRFKFVKDDNPLYPHFSNNTGVTLGDLHDTLKGYEASTGVQVGMIHCRIQNVLASGVDITCVLEAYRFKRWEDAVAMKALDDKKFEAEGDREADKAFAAVVRDV